MPHGESGSGANSVIYVHGVGNQDRESLLKPRWDDALFGRGMGALSSMAYWADLRRDRAIEQIDLDQATDEQLAAALVEPDPTIADRLAAVEFATAYLRDAVATETYRSALVGEGDDPTQLIPRWLREPLLWLVTKALVDDAHMYFFDPDKSWAMKERLRSKLRSSASPTMIAAHSLGSFIAYDVLHEAEFSSSAVACFITFGSHLGVRAVQDHVTEPLVVPSSVRTGWHNFLDADDPFPLGELIGPDYTPHVVEDRWVDNTSEDNHAAVGYLRTDSLREAAYASLAPSDG